MMWNT